MSELTLQFADAELEADFRRAQAHGALAAGRVAALSSLGLWATVALLLPHVTTNGLATARTFMLAAVLFLVAALGLLRPARGFMTLQAIALVVNVSGAAAMLGVTIVSDLFDTYGVAGTMIATLFAFFFNRMAFPTACFSTAIYLFAFGVARALCGEASWGIRIFDAVLVYTTATVSAATAYVLERTAREVFRQRRIIQALCAQLERR